MFTSNAGSWVTATAFVAVIIFVLKIVVDALIELQRRWHLLSALGAYVAVAKDDLENSKQSFNVKAMKQKIESADEKKTEYTPYALYDSSHGLELRDVMLEYGFLDSVTMHQVVKYMTAENYLHSISKELRAEYVRGFPSERKIIFLEITKKVLEHALESSQAAHEAIQVLRKQNLFQQLKEGAKSRS